MNEVLQNLSRRFENELQEVQITYLLIKLILLALNNVESPLCLQELFLLTCIIFGAIANNRLGKIMN